MAIPSPIVIKKNNVEYVSKVDRAKYTIEELTRAALKDVGKFIRRRMLYKVKSLKGLRKSRRPNKAFQYWVRKREMNLQVGIKHNTWYGVDEELGTRNQRKRAILRDTVIDNIDEIRRIEGQYLSAIEDENRALGLIDEGEGKGNDED